MASKAYLKTLKEIPKEIQKDVIESVSIANEIHLVLKQKNLYAADLARMLNKTESEISKWLTGQHNFTFKTVRKISDVLEVDLIVTWSSKVEEYEEKIAKYKKKLEQLENKINRLTTKTDPDYGFNKPLSFTISSILQQDSDSMDERYLTSFIPYETNNDKIKIKAESKSTLSFQVLNC